MRRPLRVEDVRVLWGEVIRQPAHNLGIAWASPRWRRALLIAVLSDALGFGVVLFPPAQWFLDAATAGALFAVLGFRWTLLFALAIEVVPGLALFPAWTLVVIALAATEARRLRSEPRTARGEES